MTDSSNDVEKPAKKEKVVADPSPEKVADLPSEKIYQVGPRELVLSFALFVLLFGGVTLSGGFFMGIYSAQHFFATLDYEGEPNTINTVTKYCNEMGDAYRQRDVYSTRVLERQDAELAYIDAFLKGKGAALDPGMKRMARQMAKELGVGGAQKVKHK